MLRLSRFFGPPTWPQIIFTLMVSLLLAGPSGCSSPSDVPSPNDTGGDAGDQDVIEVTDATDDAADATDDAADATDVSCLDPNPCGGCAELEHLPGQTCSLAGCPAASGQWQCAGLDAVTCSLECCPAEEIPCTPCEEGDTQVCGPEGLWVPRLCARECPAGETKELQRPCGYCGTQVAISTCGDHCTWEEPDVWEACDDEGPHWETIIGPQDDQDNKINHIGTDGTDLYVVLGTNELHRYTWPTDGDPTEGTWLKLAPPPLPISDANSFGGLGYHVGHLYATAILTSPNVPRTLVRYDIDANTWEEWKSPAGVHRTASFSNALIMDPDRPGVGYAAHHAGYQWIRFDWGSGQTMIEWLTTTALVGNPSGWISRNESVTRDPDGVYYATRNVDGLALQPGDMVYRFTVNTDGTASAPSFVFQKPWKAGLGQSLAWIDASMTPSGQAELWLIRGLDAADDPQEGRGTPTRDWARYPLGGTGMLWQLHSLPSDVDERGELRRVRDAVFVRGSGNSWYVAPLCPIP